MDEDDNIVASTSSSANKIPVTSAYNEFVTVPSKSITTGPMYKSEWESFPEFQSWLRGIPEDTSKAWCRACEKIFRADLKCLRVHGVGKSHVRMVQSKFPEAAKAVSSPTVAYNVITDRKGTYGIGIISKSDSSLQQATSGSSTLYVNPSGKNTQLLACDQLEAIESSVVVSVPKRKGKQVTGSPLSETDANQDEDDDEVMEGEVISEGNQIKRLKLANGNEKRLTLDQSYATEDDDDILMDTNNSASNRQATGRMDKEARLPLPNCTRSVNVYPPTIVGRAMVTRPAPFWKSKAIVNGHVTELKSTDYLGRYLVLFFYPQDFSRLCPNEVIAISDRISEFRAINAEVVACSVDSHLTHQAWSRISRADGGIAYPKIAILTDASHSICKSYGCYMSDNGHTLRAHYIIDPRGIIRHMTINDLTVGRSVNELLRLIEAFRHTDETETTCPTDWKPGQRTIC